LAESCISNYEAFSCIHYLTFGGRKYCIRIGFFDIASAPGCACCYGLPLFGYNKDLIFGARHLIVAIFLRFHTSNKQQLYLCAMEEKPVKISVITLGCSKNTVDSERLIAQLKHQNLDVVHDDYDGSADKVIINTCGFIGDAKEESINTILSFLEEKRKGHVRDVIVMGCLSERYKEDLLQELPEVSAIYGSDEIPNIVSDLQLRYQDHLYGERETTTPPHYAYLKISEGCNRTCAFCAIPLMRGRHQSLSIESLVGEAKHLASRGVKELILIAQELTYYGIDLYKKRALPELLEALSGVPGIEWIRLHYAYPSKFPMEILEVMARSPKICQYLDIPFQHASDRVLHLMKRNTTSEDMLRVIQRARELMPDISIRTTMLVGFPGETEADFDILKAFVREHRFDRLGVFQYSHEEDTVAYEMVDDVPPKVKERRANELMELQAPISHEKNIAKIGRTFRVLIDAETETHYIGRTEGDSPEIDNEVLVSKDKKLNIGAFYDVEITNAEVFELVGRVGAL